MTGSDATMSAPPAQTPNSATGCGSDLTRRNAASRLSCQLSGLRIGAVRLPLA